ncbi:MAG: ATP-binding cassette domain-containing protein [Gammaproteobacteria bacterium]|nr:ATP-binding cassette domain-containing protein [Gammaproteobacteria bacterium]
MTTIAIEVSKLTKVYPPDLKAVNDLSLQVMEGEIMALLGPNGAGKSTTIRILSTLSGFDDGKAVISGIDVDRNPEQVRQAIGVVAQQTGVDYFMTGRENMVLQGHLYKMDTKVIHERVEELADYFEFKKSLDKMVSTYSGGMRRKLDIATALIHRPKVLFLDEPTLGLDIHSRKILWRYIEELNSKFGLTILLTTHYLEEADSLSDRVAIINAGKIQVIGTSDELKNSIHGDSVKLSFDSAGQNEKAYAAQLKQLDYVTHITWEGNNLYIYVDDGASRVAKIMEQAGHHQVTIKTLSLARPTLDDVFLKYTGTSMLEKKDDEGQDEWWKQWAGKGGGGNWKKWAGDGEDEAGDGSAWQGNEWVNPDGTQKTDWGNDPNWQGNEWVNKDGKPKEQPAATQTKEQWQGNEWVSPDGSQKGDWGKDPNWQGNEWVDPSGKPKADWQGKPQQTTDSTPDNWKGNEWVDKEGQQQGDWGKDPNWQGNEWVDKDGKPKKDDWKG